MPHQRWTPSDWSRLLDRLPHECAVLVQVEHTQGSVPREAGAWMAVFAHDSIGTIGGGQLEWQALQAARAHAVDPHWQQARQRHALGPSLGQCCGGVVGLRLRRVGAADIPHLCAELAETRTSVALFGAGHVAGALVQALAPLPFAVHWVDSRDAIFPHALPPQVQTEHSDPVHRAVSDLVPGSLVLVMSFSHAEDLDIVAACLQRQRERTDLPFVGLIGSRSKWARFGHRLQARGYTQAELAHVHCPIGVPGITGKQPAVIAASIAAQLLQHVTN